MAAKKSENLPRLDIIGRELKEGDYVVFQTPGMGKGMKVGKIMKCNPRSAKVEYNFGHTTTGRYLAKPNGDRYFEMVPYSSNRSYNELVKMSDTHESDLMVFLLKQ